MFDSTLFLVLGRIGLSIFGSLVILNTLNTIRLHMRHRPVSHLSTPEQFRPSPLTECSVNQGTSEVLLDNRWISTHSLITLILRWELIATTTLVIYCAGGPLFSTGTIPHEVWVLHYLETGLGLTQSDPIPWPGSCAALLYVR